MKLPTAIVCSVALLCIAAFFTPIVMKGMDIPTKYKD